MLTYHKDIGFPRGFCKPEGKIALLYSEHALAEANSDRYGQLPVPKTLNLTTSELVEITFDSRGLPFKGVYRLPRTIKTKGGMPVDVVIVLVVEYATANVRTVWCNMASDTHNTLRRERYAVPA